MSLSIQEVIQHIELAENVYKAQRLDQMEMHLSAIQENYDELTEYPDYNARYFRIFMLYIGAFEEVNVQILQEYLQALVDIQHVEASDYEYITSYYTDCSESVFEDALVKYPYNEMLHLNYALKLQAEARYTEAIAILKYSLECYPAMTEARLLLWEIETAKLKELYAVKEEADCNELLDLASETHNLKILKALQVDDRLDESRKKHAFIQFALWKNKSAVIKEKCFTEWNVFEITDKTRQLLADFGKAFLYYDLISLVTKTPRKPVFPEEDFTNFEEYKVYMHALANSGWQHAQRQYLLLATTAHFHTKDRNMLKKCLDEGLAINNKNPLLLVIKAKSFYFEDNYQEASKAYNEAFINGLSTSNYLHYLLEVNNRIKSWQGILTIVNQIHANQAPILKSLYFQARALAMLHRFDEALNIINDALEDYELASYSFAPLLLYWRMIINQRNHNYAEFLKDVNAEIEYYKVGDDDYCKTMNVCVEALFEMGEYKECSKYAIYNHSQGKLNPVLYSILQWICFYDKSIQKPENLATVSENDLIPNPTTLIAFRNNALIHWILGNHIEAIENLELTAEHSTNKAFYLKLALTCAQDSSYISKSMAICEKIRTELPEARDWNTDYTYGNILLIEEKYEEALYTYKDLLKSYPEASFFKFPKDDDNVLLKMIKNGERKCGDYSAYIKYNAMYLGNDNPSKSALKEHLEIAKSQSKEDLFLRHNLLENMSRLGIKLSDTEIQALKEMKSKIRETYFV
ncbi:hypothetical protein [Formosa sp. L2A11]|uniref:hypothetical protein n=1 Tax=Formosa sp. L2A11 TaxID=2686363 RepID=UPI00131C1C0B|nr:hypothetical protein [Formosa sp. L2A11]